MKGVFIIILYAVYQMAAAQEKLHIEGEIVTAIVLDNGDTLYMAELDDVSVTSKRQFQSKEDYYKYQKYRHYANKVYPYAVKAIRVFRELEEATTDLRKSKKKKYIRRLKRDLKDEFEVPLKKLTKTQGRILVHMIEKELNTPMYFLIKELRGGVTARYWNTAGSLYGYHLRKGYIRGEDPIMDIVLDDFDISYEL